MEHTCFVGIDVSKAYLDVYVRPLGDSFRVGYDEAGFVTLIARLRPFAPVVVADAKGLAGGEHVDIEVGFRDVDTDEAGMFHDPSLHMRALSAHATVRVR